MGRPARPHSRSAVAEKLISKTNIKRDKTSGLLAVGRSGQAIPQPGCTYQLTEIGEGQTLTEAVKELSTKRSRGAQSIEPISCMFPMIRYIRFSGLENTGQAYPRLCGFGSDIKASAPETSYRDPSIVVAVIDTGLDLTHRDLQANLWINTGEIPGNGMTTTARLYRRCMDTTFRIKMPILRIIWGTARIGDIAACGNNNLDITGPSWMRNVA